MKLEYRIYRGDTGHWIAENDRFSMFLSAETILELEKKIIEHDKYLENYIKNEKNIKMSEYAIELKEYLLKEPE